MFLKIMHEKTNLQQKWLKSKIRVSIKKNYIQRIINDIFCNFCQQQNDNFLRDPKRRLIKENQEKQCQETLKNPQKHGTDKE